MQIVQELKKGHSAQRKLRICLRSVQNQSTDLFCDVLAEIARSKMFMKHD